MELARGNGKSKTVLLSFALSLTGLFSLPQMLNLRERSLGFTNSFLSVLLWILCFLSFQRILTNVRKVHPHSGFRRIWLLPGVTALLFSLCMEFGARLDAAENVDFTQAGLWIALPFLTGFFAVFLRGAWDGLSAWRNRRGKEGWSRPAWTTAAVNRWNRLSGRDRGILTVLLFVICWLPALLAVYPGFFTYDALDEVNQLMTRQFNTHHPLLHVLLLGAAVLGGNKLTGSYNNGIFDYILCQMIVLACIFTYLLHFLRKRGASPTLRFLTAIWFAVFPVNVMYILCSTKDGLFSGAMLLFVLFTAQMVEDADGFFRSRGKMAAFVLSAFFMMMFRHNAFYVFAVFLPLLLWVMKKWRRQTLLLAGSAALAYLACTAGLAALLNASGGERQELLTVPIQQLARVYTYDREDLTEEELETLYEILPENKLRLYRSKVSDDVKAGFRNEVFTRDPARYAGLWFRVGLRHPFTYVNAWLMTSYGFWYPDTVIDVYRGNTLYTYTYEDSSYFGYEVEPPGERESRIPWLNEWYRRLSLEITQQKAPVLSMLFSPGFLFWLYVFGAGYLLDRRRGRMLVPLAPIGLLWLTYLLGPTYLVRYVVILWFALPYLAALFL